jgi:hypothetical protein
VKWKRSKSLRVETLKLMEGIGVLESNCYIIILLKEKAKTRGKIT